MPKSKSKKRQSLTPSRSGSGADPSLKAGTSVTDPSSYPAKKKQKQRPLTHDEVWDDSALLRSWDDAVREYEYYHSIVARGEDVDEVLRAAEMDEKGKGSSAVSVKRKGDEDDLDEDADEEEFEEGELEDDEEDEPGETIEDEDDYEGEGNLVDDAYAASGNAAEGIDNADQRENEVQDQAQNQTLENLKLAYWWAGYYSGLYEGQRQAQRQSSRDKGR